MTFETDVFSPKTAGGNLFLEIRHSRREPSRRKFYNHQCSLPRHEPETTPIRLRQVLVSVFGRLAFFHCYIYGKKPPHCPERGGRRGNGSFHQGVQLRLDRVQGRGCSKHSDVQTQRCPNTATTALRYSGLDTCTPPARHTRRLISWRNMLTSLFATSDLARPVAAFRAFAESKLIGNLPLASKGLRPPASPAAIGHQL